jgi:hypothetical protein
MCSGGFTTGYSPQRLRRNCLFKTNHFDLTRSLLCPLARKSESHPVLNLFLRQIIGSITFTVVMIEAGQRRLSRWKTVYLFLLAAMLVTGIILKDWLLPAALLSFGVASAISPEKSRAAKAAFILLTAMTIILGTIYFYSKWSMPV